jgi:hypothetical protein
MDFIKKFIVRLIWGIGISLVLIFVFSGALIWRNNPKISKVQEVQASPGPACTVSDDLEVQKTLLVGCIGIEGGCLNNKDSVKCSSSAKSCSCDSGKDIAEVICPDGYYVIAGGCDSDSGTVGLSHNTWIGNPPNGWYCNWAGGVGWERAKAICCRIQENWDPTLKSMPSGGT